MNCTFFGHNDTPSSVIAPLTEILIDLIDNKDVRRFYVGNHGNFDFYVRKVLNDLKKKYSFIEYVVVLAYLPKNEEFSSEDKYDTIYPEQVANGPAKFAILRRNTYMLENADYVITYVHRIYGGAQQFKEKAINKGKIVINICK